MQGIDFILTILPLIAGAIALFLAFNILLGNRSSRNILFAYFAISMGLWAVLISVYLLSDNFKLSILAVHGYYFFAAALIHAMLLFCLYLDKTNSHKGRRLFSVLATLPFLAIGVTSLIPGALFGMSEVADKYHAVTLNKGPYLVYTFYFVVYFIGSVVLLRRAYLHEETRLKKRQVMSVVYALSIATVFGALFNLFLPLLGDYSLIMIGPLFVLWVVVVIAYSMIRHSLFELRTAAVRTMAYTLSLSALALIYYGLAFLASIAISGTNQSSITAFDSVYMVLALLLAFLFQPVKKLFDRITNKVFFRNRYEVDDLVASIGKVVTSTSKLDKLLLDSASIIQNMLGSSFVLFSVNNPSQQVEPVTFATSKPTRLTKSEMSRVEELAGLLESIPHRVGLLEQSHLKLSSRAVNISELQALMTKKSVSIIMPLGDVGFLLIGESVNRGYSEHDVRALQTIGNELIIAIRNARSVEEIRVLNKNLEKRIKHATRELQDSNNELRQLDTSKDEFISMASHQLRTPLTSVKGYLSMVLDGDVGEITNTQRQMLTEAFSSSERMVHLISDFLSVSRLSTGKFIIDKKITSLTSLVKEEIELVSSLVSRREMHINYKVTGDIPLLAIDEDKVRQVVMNFIDNAVFYSRPRATIVVKLYRTGNWVNFEVHDQGIGVPKDSQAKLFTKFFRAKNARKQRPDGTGVGLFLAKKVITEHDGKIIFESTEGKGSVFGFSLPVNNSELN